MIKLYATVNMHYDTKSLLTMSNVTWLLRERAQAARSQQELDQKVIEIQIEGKSGDIKEKPPEVPTEDLEPGLWRSSKGFVWFKGDPTLFKEIRTISQPQLDDPHIPRTTIVAVIEQYEQLRDANWYQCDAVKSTIERFKPKWICKGHVVCKIGEDKVRIDYIPVTLNEQALRSVTTDLFNTLTSIGNQIEEVFVDHGSKQELTFLDQI